MLERLGVESAAQQLSDLEEIVRVRPSLAAIAQLASCYYTLNQPERALPLARYVWDRDRSNAAIALNIGLTLRELGRHEEALSFIESAYMLNPAEHYIRLGYGEALLRAGFWDRGWPIYDNARPTQKESAVNLHLPGTVREWMGEPISNGKLLVINEGGAGDRLCYARWLDYLSARGIDWAFYPYSEFFSFFARAYPRHRLVADGDDINPTHWTTAFSLPARLGASPVTIPPPVFLTAAPESETKYRLTRSDALPMIGLCYAASELCQGGKKVRSLTEGQAMRLVCGTADKVHWVNLQHGVTMPYPVSNIPFRTWEDTAGLIANLDAVVSVDTGTLHLVGSMGKPLHVLLSGNSDWKYLSRGSTTRWYPTAKLYRNTGYGMETAVSALVTELRS